MTDTPSDQGFPAEMQCSNQTCNTKVDGQSTAGEKLPFLASSPSFVSNTSAKRVLPSEDGAKNHNHHIQPKNQKQLFPPNCDFPLALFPFVAYFEEPLRIVGNDPVKLVFDAPSHHIHFINRPADHRPTQCSCVAQEFGSEGPNEHLLK